MDQGRKPFQCLSLLLKCTNGCRCNVQRLRHAGRKNGQFVMLDAFNGQTMIACLNAKSRVYDLFLHTSQAGELISP